MVSIQVSPALRGFVHETQFFQNKGYVEFVAHWVGAQRLSGSSWSQSGRAPAACEHTCNLSHVPKHALHREGTWYRLLRVNVNIYNHLVCTAYA
jgi:hypothetical protein